MIESMVLKEIAKEVVSEATSLKDFFVEKTKAGLSDAISQEASLVDNCRLPRTGGEWVEINNETHWKPNPDVVPDPDNGKNGNPNGLTWGEILDKYDIETIVFKDGYPDFSTVMESEVKIDDFTTDRRINFNQADTKQAEQWNAEGKDGKTDWSPGDVSQWRKDNNYTWHECEDCETMQLVPAEVHNNIPHSGGISVAKAEELSKENEEV
ncbi:HNH endonuclease [Neisseriaceae bacterium CLB008]